MIDRNRVIEVLEEWSSIEEQRRLWLSDGANGAEVSSFIEAWETLFTDTGLWHDLENGRSVFGDPIDSELKRFDSLIARIDYARAPREVIEDEAMHEVRSTARGLLASLRH